MANGIRHPGSFGVRRPDRSVNTRIPPGSFTQNPGMRAPDEFTDVTSRGYNEWAKRAAERGGAKEYATSVEEEERREQADEVRNLVLMALVALSTYGGATVPASRAAQGGFERLALEGRRRKGAGMGAEVLEREALAIQQRTGAYGMGRANRMTERDIANWYLSRGAPQVAPRVAIPPGRTGHGRNPAEVTGRGPWQPEDPRMLVSGFSGRTGGWGRPDAPVWDMSHLTQAQRRRAFNDYTRDRARWRAAQ